MSLGGAFVQRGLRWGALGVVTLLVATAVNGDADARSRRHHRPHHHAAAAESYQPSTASIVVDANSGAVMEESNADSTRHPASLSKIMTLYLLFERLQSGKIKMSTELPVSAHAAAQAPTKLGLKPGQTISVENAILGIVTRSANDAAVVVAEALGGDEASFGQMMTAKARALGMMHTNYHNASGLPDDLQITTARDQSILARAIQDRFPQYYHYFSARSFVFRGTVIRNHNHLLGSVPGVDGMKTGYIRASGFNIVTSVRRGNRHIIAVVFGGRTARARDARVISLIDNNINVASARRTAPPVVEGWETAQVRGKARPAAERAMAITPTPIKDPRNQVTVAATPDTPAPGSTAPIKPNPVKTFTVHPGAMRTASLSPLPAESRGLAPAPATANLANVTNVVTVKSEPPAMTPPPGARPGVLGVLPAKVASAGESVSVTSSVPEPAAKSRGGWMIQIGAFDDEKEAKHHLVAAQSKAKSQLGKADPFTERVNKGEKSLYRARFAGLGKEQAEVACKHLKRSDIPCMLLKN